MVPSERTVGLGLYTIFNPVSEYNVEPNTKVSSSEYKVTLFVDSQASNAVVPEFKVCVKYTGGVK